MRSYVCFWQPRNLIFIQLVTHVTANKNIFFWIYLLPRPQSGMSLPQHVTCRSLYSSNAYHYFFLLEELTDLRDSLKEISEIVLNLRNLGQRLRAGLNEARDNLTAAKEECTNDPPSVQAGACDKIPSWDDLQAEADFNQVSNLCARYPTISSSLTSTICSFSSPEPRILWLRMTRRTLLSVSHAQKRRALGSRLTLARKSPPQFQDFFSLSWKRRV